MSATRDTETHSKFIFSNFYHLYLQSKAAKAADSADHLKGAVLRAGRVTEAPVPAQVTVISSHEQESLKKWATHETSESRTSMAEQIKTLRNARKRLNFLMSEIDDILKRD
jgi:hypothetical protein